MMKLMSIFGTRPEIIRLSKIFPLLDSNFDHIMVNTHQNYTNELNNIFFKELKILRDQMAHNDEQISCTDDLVAKAKTVTNEINSQMLAWRGL